MTAPMLPILSVRNLSTCFRTDMGPVTAVDDVSFDLAAGEVLAIVGESGCGKTVTSKSIMRLLPERTSWFKPESRIIYTAPDRPRSLAAAAGLPPSLDLVAASDDQMRRVRGARIAMIFQEPMTSLNPVFTVGWQIEEALKYHTGLGPRERRQRAIEMLRLVEIPSPEKRVDEYPHQLSGGMRQRVMIAIALCCEPDILIADEPTTALDVTIQAQILELMGNLRKKLNTAIMVITHNLGVVAQFCDRVIVMYAGRIIECGPVRDIFHAPLHPYTRALRAHAGRLGAGLGGLVRRDGGDAVHLFPADGRVRLQAGGGRADLRAGAPGDVYPGRRQCVRSQFQRGHGLKQRSGRPEKTRELWRRVPGERTPDVEVELRGRRYRHPV
ncbi:ABC transporter ATP-binding protein [Leptolyngbya sp. 15MV]|nr:ABC transporter ATP-binding protein [Leptolyngbya sp. 15MV]